MAFFHSDFMGILKTSLHYYLALVVARGTAVDIAVLLNGEISYSVTVIYIVLNSLT